MPIIEAGQVTHPLLGRRVPTLKSLLERSATEATKVLEAATAFARARIADQTRASAIAVELQRAPWGEPELRWHEPPRAVTSTDLLRALLALHGDRLTEIAFGPDNTSAQFREAEEHWKRALVGALDAPSAEPLELEPIWARRWAMTDATSIDRDTLVGCLARSSLRQLALFDERYTEGLITDEEALNKAIDQMAWAGVPARFSISMPPAYLDRHGGLSALDELLARPPGVIIVGPRGSGRHALVEAWGRRFRSSGPAHLRRFGFNIDNFHGGGWVEWRGASVTTWAAVGTRSIAVMSSFGAELDSPNAETRRFPEYCLEFASTRENEFRLVIVTTPEDLEPLEGQLPMLRGFPRLEVPAIRDDELLALWICQTPALEDRLGLSLPIWRLVDRLADRSEMQRRRFDRTTDLLGTTARTDHEAALRSAAGSVLKGTWSEARLEALTRRIARDPALASWVVPESWPSLVRLDAALHVAP